MDKKGRILFTRGDVDTLNDFSVTLEQAFINMGYETALFDVNDMMHSLATLSEFAKEPVICVITFNNLAYNLELSKGYNTWEQLNIPIVNILMDHPFCYKKALDNAPPNMVVLCPDQNHMRYVKRFFPHIPIAGFLAHAGKPCDIPIKPIRERSIDILYCGGISVDQIENAKPDFSAYAFDAKKVCTEAIEDILENPSKTSEQGIEEALLNNGISLSDEELSSFISDCRYVDMTVVSVYREKIIRVLVESGLDVTIYGNDGWTYFDWIQNKHAKFMGRIDASLVPEKMQDAKIVLNTQTWFKDGTHDRIFNGMLQGAAVVSDASVYLNQIFSDELLLFELEEIDVLPDMVKTLLNDADAIQEMADKGRSIALKQHTWEARANELEADLFPYL